jgi:hypothetical protein
MAAYAIYQYAVEMPALVQLAKDADKLRREAQLGGLNLDTEALRQRIAEPNVYATFIHPNSFAGYLALLIPGLVGAAWAARRGPHWRTALAGLCLLVGLTALWLTHSRGALLATLLVAAVVGVWFGRRWLWAHKGIALGGAAALLLAAALAWYGGLFTAALGKGTGTMAVRLEYWRATGRMIAAKPWWGVGPGQFRRAYPRFMDETAVEKVADPHNFALEMWTAAGPIALAGLLLALGWFFVRAWRHRPTAEDEAAPQTPATHLGHWPFYVGGMFGLVIGFLLGLPEQIGSSEVMEEGYKAAGRSVIWFLAFGLFERLVWTERARSLCLTAGVAAALLNLCVSGGIGFPQVALPLWVCVALALNAPPLRTAWPTEFGGLVVRVLPALLLAGLVFGFAAYIYYPINAGQTAARQALRVGRLIRADMDREPGKHEMTPSTWVNRLTVDVILPLQKASKEDPGNSWLLLQWAEWSVLRDRFVAQPLYFRPNLPSAEKEARALDPENLDCYRLPFELYFAYAERLGAAAILEKQALPGLVLGPAVRALPGEATPTAQDSRPMAQRAREEYRRAADTLAPVRNFDPTGANWRYLLAEAYRKAGDLGGESLWRREARTALDLDAKQPHEPGQITRALQPEQRRRLEEWLAAAPTR